MCENGNSNTTSQDMKVDHMKTSDEEKQPEDATQDDDEDSKDDTAHARVQDGEGATQEGVTAEAVQEPSDEEKDANQAEAERFKTEGNEMYKKGMYAEAEVRRLALESVGNCPIREIH